MIFKISLGVMALVLIASIVVIIKSESVPSTIAPDIAGFTPVPSISVGPTITPISDSGANDNDIPRTDNTPTPSSMAPSDEILQDVPFTAQAPSGNWDDPKQQNGCEEASVLMAVKWIKGEAIKSSTEAEKDIINISDYEAAFYGSYWDTSVADTIKRIFVGYYGISNARAKYNITVDDIVNELKLGNIVLVPTNGQKLNNPNYKPPGPTHHMLVIKGYSSKTDEFITNDPGTRKGEGYRYPTLTVLDSIYDYKTGKDEPVDSIVKAMIVVSK